MADHGYGGDVENYDDPANANLIRVIERRRGLPVALGILWLHAARAAGWAAHGIDFPGHFLLALTGRGEQRVVDVFAGGAALDARDLRALIKRVEGAEGGVAAGPAAADERPRGAAAAAEQHQAAAPARPATCRAPWPAPRTCCGSPPTRRRCGATRRC